MFINCAQQVWKLQTVIKIASPCFQKHTTFLTPKPDKDLGNKANSTKKGKFTPIQNLPTSTQEAGFVSCPENSSCTKVSRLLKTGHFCRQGRKLFGKFPVSSHFVPGTVQLIAPEQLSHECQALLTCNNFGDKLVMKAGREREGWKSPYPGQCL